MKMIVYNIDLRLNPDDKFAVICKTAIPYSEENAVYAETHSVDGKYTIEEWGSNHIVAPHNIMEGEYVTIDGVLYMATENIPKGEPIIVGQNAASTTVEAQLYELKGE